MHSFEVHSNESACRKKVRLGLEQVMYGKIGNKVADILASKHPSLTPPDMEEFLWYEVMPTLMEINIML